MAILLQVGCAESRKNYCSGVVSIAPALPAEVEGCASGGCPRHEDEGRGIIGTTIATASHERAAPQPLRLADSDSTSRVGVQQ